MSFLEIYDKQYRLDLNKHFEQVSSLDAERALNKDEHDMCDFLALLSPKAENLLEQIAQKANKTTVQYFGKVIQLYTPMYLSNYCVNSCSYCSFNAENPGARKKLSKQEIKKEAECIAAAGLRHILILTGDSRQMSPVSYIKECVELLKNYFSSISLETYALSQEEYAELIKAGVDGVTIYQEVYDRKIYDLVHTQGPKKDFDYRLDSAERALKEGIRTANIGALLGLNDWRKEIFFTGLHARYLQAKFTSAEIGVSVPRLRPHLGKFKDAYPVTDKNLAQIIIALRIFLPRVGISLSTREDANLRDNLIALGITRISAGSTTAVGGHTLEYIKGQDEQFQIADTRSAAQIKEMLLRKHYQPVLKDWMSL